MVRESGSIRVMMIFPSLSPSRTAHVLPCQRIHAMPFSMDIIFIPATGEGAFLQGNVKRWSFLPWFSGLSRRSAGYGSHPADAAFPAHNLRLFYSLTEFVYTVPEHIQRSLDFSSRSSSSVFRSRAS